MKIKIKKKRMKKNRKHKRSSIYWLWILIWELPAFGAYLLSLPFAEGMRSCPHSTPGARVHADSLTVCYLHSHSQEWAEGSAPTSFSSLPPLWSSRYACFSHNQLLPRYLCPSQPVDCEKTSDSLVGFLRVVSLPYSGRCKWHFSMTFLSAYWILSQVT